MSRVDSNVYTEANVMAQHTIGERFPLSVHHGRDALGRRPISEEIRQCALLMFPAILGGTDAARAGHADPLPASAIASAVAVSITRAKSAVALETPTVAVDIDDVDESRISSGAWLAMGTPNPEAVVTGWSQSDTMAIVERHHGQTLAMLRDAMSTATDADPKSLSAEALVVRAAGLRSTDRRAVKVREAARQALDDVRLEISDVVAWRTDVRREARRTWDDDARELAASLVKVPGMTRNTWSQGDRTTSGAASLVYVRAADGTASMLDPRNGVRTPLAADVPASLVLSAVVVPAWERDAESRASDLYADAQEPLGRVAEPNRRKTRRAGGVGGPVVTGRARPRRV